MFAAVSQAIRSSQTLFQLKADVPDKDISNRSFNCWAKDI